MEGAGFLTGDAERARWCARLARDSVEDPSTRDWLDKDERGTWEEHALDCLRRAPGIMAEKGLTLSDEEVDRQVAGVPGEAPAHRQDAGRLRRAGLRGRDAVGRVVVRCMEAPRASARGLARDVPDRHAGGPARVVAVRQGERAGSLPGLARERCPGNVRERALQEAGAAGWENSPSPGKGQGVSDAAPES